MNELETTAYVSSGTELLKWSSDQLTVFVDGFVALGDLTVDPRGALVVADRGAGKLFSVDEDGEARLLAGGGTKAGAGIPATEVLLPGLRSAWPDDAGGYFLGLHEPRRRLRQAFAPEVTGSRRARAESRGFRAEVCS